MQNMHSTCITDEEEIVENKQLENFDLDESLKMVNILLHLCKMTLQINVFTKFYLKCLELKKEKRKKLY